MGNKTDMPDFKRTRFPGSATAYMLFILILALSTACRTGKKGDLNPNILLILTDDMGYGDYSQASNPYLRTPILDDMASGSVRFKYFYVSPVCAPTRASLLTGKYHQRTGVRSVTNGYETMDPDETTLAEILRSKGYSTAIFGKWHLGEYFPSLPNEQGFEEYLGFRTGHTEDYFDPMLEHNGSREPAKGYITDLLTDRAIAYMRNRKEQPFFCYLAYNAPHTPLQVDSAYFKRFLELGLSDRTARVYGMIENIDENIGRLFSFLGGEGLLDETIVIFLSDNGPISGWRIPQEEMRYNAGLRDQKFTVYEGGIRTQCFWQWQDHWNSRYDTSTIAAHVDILPTLLDITGFPVPDSLKVDGTSLLPALNGKENILEDRIYFENYSLSTLTEPAPYPGGMARQGRWKMVNGNELYNLYSDPGESRNLAGEHPEILQRLQEAYMTFYHDSYTEGNFFPKPIRVGFEEENPVRIQPHHGRAHGNIQFLNPNGNVHPTGVDGSVLASWKEAGDGITWQLQPVFDGTYRIGISGKGHFGTTILGIAAGRKNQLVELSNVEELQHWTYLELTQFPLERGETVQLKLQLEESEGADFQIKEVLLERL